MPPPAIATKLAIARLVTRVLSAKIRRDGRPFIVAHHVTNRCMCNCASCLWRHNDWKDVPAAEIKRFYDQARAAGFVAAAVTGGEPLLRRDLGELLRHIKRRCHMNLLLFTTGWQLEARMDEILPQLDVLILSIDSADPARHDEIRGLKGLHARLLRAARLARERYPGVTLHFNCCIQKGVEGEIDELVRLTEDLDMHISFDVITELRHGEDGSGIRVDVGMPLETLRHVCAYLLWKKRDGAPILNSESYFEYFVRGRKGYRCHMPKVLMFVDGLGNIEDCLDLGRPIANIRELPLAQIMELPRFKQLRADAERCSSCNSPTMIDTSHVWERPMMAFTRGGISLG